MKGIFAILAVGLTIAAAFSGCIGGEKAMEIENCVKCGYPMANCTCNQTIVVDFSTIMAQAPTDVAEGVAHWKFSEGANFMFQDPAGIGISSSSELQQFTYDLKLPNGTVAVEVLCDWESPNLDLDMFFLKNGKDTGFCTPNYMVNDPMVAVNGDQGTTWEYFNAVQNKTKKFTIPTDYQVRVDVFNNWEPTAAAGTPTPFTLDIWVYTAEPAQWHTHQELGQ